MATAKEIPDFSVEKFLSKASVDFLTGCWNWTSKKSTSGYGLLVINSNAYRAHRVSFHLFKKISSLENVIDHICMNRACVNPDHLREVTAGTNTLENSNGVAAKNKIKTHCKRGHLFDEKNTTIKTQKRSSSITIGRQCKICKYMLNKESRMRNPRRKKNEL